MKALTETVISLFDLAEAEGRLLQQKLVQTFGVALLMLLAAGLVLLALVLFLLAFYEFLLQYWPPSLSLLVVGMASLLLGGMMSWLALHTQHRL